MRSNGKVRMNRLFGSDRCLDVAIDHGVCNEPSFLGGLEDIDSVDEWVEKADAELFAGLSALLAEHEPPDLDWSSGPR